jgi:hypothetical protein
MTAEKTTIEILEEVNYKIARLENSIIIKNNEIILENLQLEKLKEQQKNLINYLNHDND